jgi:hypothetical protein
MSAPTSAAKTPVRYRKLTRMHRGVGQMTQLWLGDDHLLQVQSTGYSESYRRFYLRDIQSMLIVHTNSRLYLALTLLVPMFIIALVMRSADSGPLGYGVLVGIFLPFFIWNHLLGPGCRVVVITAVKQEKVPSLSRLSKTRRILEELKPQIETAQADLAAAPVAETPGTTPPMPPPLPPALPS